MGTIERSKMLSFVPALSDRALISYGSGGCSFGCDWSRLRSFLKTFADAPDLNKN